MENACGDDEDNEQRRSLEIVEVDPEVVVYISETEKPDIPDDTLVYLFVVPSVGEIRREAFEWTSLLHVQLPLTLTRIGRSAFGFCYCLESVQFYSYYGPFDSASVNSNLEDGISVFPEGQFIHIDDYAFDSCSSMQKIIFCSVYTTIGKAVFQNCYRLISVELPEELQVVSPALFDDCRSLTTVKIPSSVIKIGRGAFHRCFSLTDVGLPHGLLEIGACSFEDCRSIEALVIPPTVSTIGELAFGFCSALKHIKLPPTLECIEPHLCDGCKRLDCIEFSSTVKRIGSCAFADCKSLSHVRIPACVESFANDAFVGCGSMISIEIPEHLSSGVCLYGCLSLMNVYGGMEYDQDFLKSWSIRSVVDGRDEIARRLKHRFDNAPVNKLCYYQSYHSPSDAMIQLRGLLHEDPLAATTEVDEFGMTPLHTLSLSQAPNMDMLVALMNGGNLDHIFQSWDSFESTPMDYLCLNRMPQASHVIRRVLQTRFGQLLGLDSRPWKSDILQAIDEALDADWTSRRYKIIIICWKLANYEREEVFSIMELYLWKMKIDEVGSMKGQIADRQSCLLNSGASVVIPHVLTFLDDEVDMDESFSRSLGNTHLLENTSLFLTP
eukprot:scaffold1089_cov117-Cylindrotheca_fusiformis.AAC.7